MTNDSGAMSDERLAEIRRKQGKAWLNGDKWQADYRFDVADLLADNERLHTALATKEAREAAAMEIVGAVAAGSVEIAKFGTVNKTQMRVLCLRSDVRSIQEQARALLASAANEAK